MGIARNLNQSLGTNAHQGSPPWSETLRRHLPQILLIAALFGLRLGISFFLLHSGWLPSMRRDGYYDSYDAERYFANSLKYIEGIPVQAMNWTGAMVYYGWIFKILGQTPEAACLVNNLLTGLSAWFLWRTANIYQVLPQKHRWLLPLFAFSPEVLWFDTITSKEAPLTNLTLLWTILMAIWLTRPLRWRSTLLFLTALGGLTVCLASIRFPMVFSLAVALGASILIRVAQISRRAAVILSASAALLTGIFLAGHTWWPDAYGVVATEYEHFRDTYLLGGGAFSATNTLWATKSVGRMLVPTTLITAFLLTPVRLIMYLVAPLPGLGWTWAGLQAGAWISWQQLLMSLGALLNILLVPLALSATFAALRQRRATAETYTILATWCVYLAIALGNIIIQERYRVMATPLLWILSCFGVSSRRSTQILGLSVWLLMLLGAGALYVAVKYL